MLGLEQDQEQPLAKAIVQTLEREFDEEPALGEEPRRYCQCGSVKSCSKRCEVIVLVERRGYLRFSLF